MKFGQIFLDKFYYYYYYYFIGGRVEIAPRQFYLFMREQVDISNRLMCEL